MLERALEVLRLGDRKALYARRPRPRGEVRVVGLAVGSRVETGSVLAALEVRVLQVADRPPGEVVPHHPHRRDIVFDRSAQHVRHHGESAVAADRYARAVGRGELGAEDRARAETHARETPGVQHGLRPARLPELHEPVVVDAGVERDDRVVRQHGAAVGHDALGPDRRRMDIEVRRHELFPFRAPARDFGVPFGELRGAVDLPASRFAQHLLDESARIGQYPQVRRVVAADLGVVHVDMDEFGSRDVPRVARHPRGGGAIVEASADGDDQVAITARLVGLVGPVAADEAQRQHVPHVEAPHAVRRTDDRDAVLGREFGEFLARLGQRHPVPDEDHRAARGLQHVDHRPDIIGRSAAAALGEAVPRRLERNFGLFLKQVVRHVEVDRAGPSAGHRGDGLAQRVGQHVDARRLEAVLHHWPDHIREIRLVVAVDFLERAAVELRSRHVGGDREQRGRISLCHGQRHDEVGRARPGRGQRRHGLVLHAEVAVGHVRGGLLVARRDQFDLVAHLVQRIEQADVAVATDAEDVRHLFINEEFGDQFAALLRHLLLAGSRRRSHALFGGFVHSSLL